MIPLFKPFMPEELPDLEAILHSGALAYGKYGRELESLLQKWIGCRQVVATNSYNSAALVLLASMGLKPGDEIIASPMTCLASSQPFATQGLKVRWADIDPKTGTLDPQSVRTKITSRTKAIFHNHFCGYVGYVSEIESIAKEYGLFLIDDAIEAFGSCFNGEKIGNMKSDATLLNFQTVRLPNTIEGGGIAFNNESLAAKAKIIRDYGIERAGFRDSLGEINKDCDISLPGYGATPSDVNSYIGILQMKHIDGLLHKQQSNFECWQEYCRSEKIEPVSIVEGTRPNGWIFGILSENKRDFIEEYRAKGYYASGVHLPNTYYSVFGESPELPGVMEFYSKFVALPCGWWVDI